MLKLVNKNIIERFIEVRARTIKIIESLESEDMVLQTESFVSPTKWHLAHTTWFFEKFILKKNIKSYLEFDESFNFLFNSYYNQAGEFHNKNKRGNISRPTLKNIISYRKYVDEQVVKFFVGHEAQKKFEFDLELGINHEQQHQELILMDILNIFFHNPIKPKFQSRIIKSKENFFKEKCLKIPDTNYIYGANNKTFSYDNETPNGLMKIDKFEVQSSLVTNGEWKDFIKSGGYTKPEFWLSDGWEFINKNKINKPLYWMNDEQIFTLNGISEINDHEPVSHISFYEADAFARFCDKRLPSEFEIELILSKNPINGNFLESGFLQPLGNASDEISYYGDLWVWTNSNYLPYKNYKPFEGLFSEYNGKFMCNQFVLKGGSCVTPKDHIRASYRNFYYPSDRWQFSGIRLVNN